MLGRVGHLGRLGRLGLTLRGTAAAGGAAPGSAALKFNDAANSQYIPVVAF